jgi:riboflavin kinase/FMN adenylyltransferase
MNVLTDWREFPPHLRNGVLCIGNFDGVHRGHAEMLSTGRAEALRLGCSFTIMTFDPHPSVLLKPDVPRYPLTTPAQRLELLAAFAPDVIIVIPTDRAFLSMPAEAFLQEIVRGAEPPGSGGLGARLLVEGPTFTYGRGARGTVETLRQAGPALGFDTRIVPTRQQALSDLSLVNVSSSLIRWLVENGRVADAAQALGRPYTLRGEVVEGAKRGRTIGFPTANLDTPQLRPMAGIYAGTTTVGGLTHRAAISVGTNPTFHGRHTTVEAFLLDFDGDLYGKRIDLAFHRWVREMFNFGGIPPLVAQMNRDVELTRRLIPLKEPA